MVWDVNARSHNGRTPLHEAAMASSPENAQLLLDAGAEINAVDNVGFTPLHAAAVWGNPLIISMLQENGAVDYLEDDSGRKVADMLSPNWDDSALADAGDNNESP
jgi:FOG: Ankyrin repeat